MIKLLLSLLLVFSLSCSVKFPGRPGQPAEVEKIRLPEGFHIELYCDNIKGARSMTKVNDQLIIVGTRGAGNVYAVPDENKDFIADSVYTIAEGLNSPNGVAVVKGDLYIAEINKISKISTIENKVRQKNQPEVIYDQLPNEGHHGWKYLAAGPDGKLYFGIGAPCNICESDSIFSTIARINTDGTGFELFAHGIRNTVGFDWNPANDEMWFTDNGRDWVDDNTPADELNRASTKGMHFGYPYCHGNEFSDPEFGNKRKCAEFIKPARELGPHVAALGMKFYRGKQFPESYRNCVFIAEHGSWNRKSPLGYRITVVKIENNKAISYEVFADGWLQENKAFGRPVDILELSDGSLLVSDDLGGRIYRIYYKN
jgi:glucose/arabinose dehydrogenase